MKIPSCLGPPLFLLLAATTLAGEQLPEILVTAQLRDTTLLQDSNSTSVVTSEIIQARAAQHLEEVLNTAPNVNYSGGSSRARFYQIRGIGDRSQFQEPLNPSVGLLLDGVDFSGIGTIGTLFDVEQVEILRGPQGTLHGANALAGLINIRSEAPTRQYYHRIEVSLADYQTYSLGAVSSGPLTDKLHYRVAAQQYNGDGITDNTYLDKDDTQRRDELTLRGKLRWSVAPRHSLDLGVTYIDVDNGYDAFSLDNVRDTISDQPGQDQQESLALSVQLDSSFDYFDTELALTVADNETDYGYDEDWTYQGFHPFGYSSFDRYQRQRDSSSAQLRLLSNAQSRLFAGTTGWVVGAYYLDNNEDLQRQYTYLARNFFSSYDTETAAVFGQLDASLGESFSLIGGLRWENRETDYSDNNAVDFAPDKNMWGGKIALEYAVGEVSMLYASVSRGYRANGINAEIFASINASDDPAIIDQLQTVQEYDEETLLNYELGLKANLLDKRLQVRLALFYMDREDQQVKGAFLIDQEDGGTTFVDYTDNAAQGNNYGLELESDWLATDALRLWANLGLLQTEYEDYINADGVDLSGRDQAQAPSYQYALGGRYSFTKGVYLQVDVEGKDGFYFSDRHASESDAYDLLNARLGYNTGRWQLALWGRNLSDEDFYVRGFGSFGNDPRKDYVTEPYYQLGEPRRVGVSASYTF
jgi:outer membrane receptor protein involved in Fe transport